jgi:hypothetical protein
VARYAASPIPLGKRLGEPLGMHSFTAPKRISALADVREPDAKTGVELEVPVGDGAAPLDVFRHPFAHAADHGLELRPAAGVGVSSRSIEGQAR